MPESPVQFEVRLPRGHAIGGRRFGLNFVRGVAIITNPVIANECVKEGLIVKNLSTGITVNPQRTG